MEVGEVYGGRGVKWLPPRPFLKRVWKDDLGGGVGMFPGYVDASRGQRCHFVTMVY
ncbi:MAG: hypothetical protein KDC08_10565 [Actinobacteria bacterium]|nr:hypothetical protein [Actinomycetota bacterium]